MPVKADEPSTDMKSALEDAFAGHQAYGEKPPEDRRSRTRDSRDADEIHETYEDEWSPSSVLDAKNFPPRPGFVQRWVRTKINGVDDPRNVIKRMNEQYRPRMADTVPSGKFAPTINLRQFGDVIGQDGIVLMERPEKVHQRHAAHNRELANRQMEAVNGILQRGQEPGKGFGPVSMDSRSEVSKGRPAPVADED